MYVTEALAEYSVKYQIDKVDERITGLARNFFADGMACMIAGAGAAPVKIAREYALQYGGKPEATLIATGIKTDAITAAMANGIAAHYLDYDDVADSPNAHVSVVMLPTVLAVGESISASGHDVLEAYVLGIEICSFIGRSLGKENFRRGWHSTSSLGIFGATAAAGKLLKLNQKQFAFAYGIAASESSGIKANFGTMTKSFHAGSAASKGIRAARLALLGYDSHLDAMEAKCGFADLTISKNDFRPTFEAIEKGCSEFLDPGMIMKPYPSCKGTHNAIDAAIQLTEMHALKPDDIREILIEVQPYVIDLLRFPRPKTKLEGKFSADYTVACAIAHKSVALSDFDERTPFDPVVMRLVEKTKTIANENMNNGETMLVRGDSIVTIITNDGRKLQKRVNYATGDPHVPMTEVFRKGKIRECLEQTLVKPGLEEIALMLETIDSVEDITNLMDKIAAATE